MIQKTRRAAPRRILMGTLLSIALTAVIILPPHPAQARAHAAASLPRTNASHATVIVLDMSGSMGFNDPQSYRCSAADAYIDLSNQNDYIGVVGLANYNGARSGAFNFQTAQVWSEPVNMSTLQERQALKDTIKNKSNSCVHIGTTPTYDALNQAYIMLDTITKQHAIGGSVILLTDGIPDPDTDSQIMEVRNDLVTKFQARGWPIDTIGLGQDSAIGGSTPGTFHDFLKGISFATSGKFYDDGQGVVPGVNALNIAPFFVDIFARYSGRTPQNVIPPTQLNGNTQQQNFKVTDGTSSLDVVVVKNTAQTNVTLYDANNHVVTPDGVGIFVSQDQYQFYVIYSIDQPQAGFWTLSEPGSGLFLMDSLKVTNIGLNMSSLSLRE